MFAGSSGQEIWDRFPQCVQLSEFATKLMVAEIRRRAFNENTALASCEIIRSVASRSWRLSGQLPAGHRNHRSVASRSWRFSGQLPAEHREFFSCQQVVEIFRSVAIMSSSLCVDTDSIRKVSIRTQSS